MNLEICGHPYSNVKELARYLDVIKIEALFQFESSILIHGLK